MSDIRTAESALNTATARFEKWAEKWQAKFFEPVALDAFRQLLLKMTPDQHMQMRERDPEGYDKVMKKLGIGGE